MCDKLGQNSTCQIYYIVFEQNPKVFSLFPKGFQLIDTYNGMGSLYNLHNFTNTVTIIYNENKFHVLTLLIIKIL